MKLSALDLMTLAAGESSAEKYSRTVELAKKLDELGYRRIWFSEHHQFLSHISSAPEINAAYIAGVTKSIHVGTGGTMIRHYSPLKVAEQFKSLASFAPGRVDLGLGKGAGGFEEIINALAQGHEATVDNYYEKVETILDYLTDETPKNELYSKAVASPRFIENLPEAWLLGSSGASAKKAGELGISYNFATYFGITTDPEIFKTYRKYFKPSQFQDKPNVMSAYRVVVADTDKEAAYLARPLEIDRLLQVNYKRTEPILTAEDAKNYPLTESDKKFIQKEKEDCVTVYGSKKTVADIFRAEQEKFGFDELMVYSPISDHNARLKSYELLFEALG